jgi:serine/threonine protein kinase
VIRPRGNGSSARRRRPPRSEEADSRTDIWSLGVVLYETIAGQRPFAGDYEAAVVHSILNDEPEPLTARRSNVPMELERIVGKALALDPSQENPRKMLRELQQR